MMRRSVLGCLGIRFEHFLLGARSCQLQPNLVSQSYKSSCAALIHPISHQPPRTPVDLNFKNLPTSLRLPHFCLSFPQTSFPRHDVDNGCTHRHCVQHTRSQLWYDDLVGTTHHSLSLILGMRILLLSVSRTGWCSSVGPRIRIFRRWTGSLSSAC